MTHSDFASASTEKKSPERHGTSRTQPKVSIVIPAYNAEAYLSHTIESVIQQTMPLWELCVIDDGSRDRTSDIAQSYAERDQRISIIRQQNSGVAGARNAGLDLTNPNSDGILFLDHDDILEPNTLGDLLRALQSDASLSAAYGYVQMYDTYSSISDTDDITNSFGYHREQVSMNSVQRCPEESVTDFSVLAIWPCISTPGQVLIRRKAITSVGYFDANTTPSDDWDMWIRLSLIGALRPVHQFVLRKGCHDQNLWLQAKSLAKAEQIIRDKLASSAYLTPEQHRIARVGHRHAALLRLEWARRNLAAGHIVEATKDVGRFCRRYAAYRRTRYST